MSTQDKIKVMIVDDSVIIRQMIKKYLSELNIEIVGTAGDGKSAIELFKETQPDVVTLDITMPKVDGFTVLENDQGGRRITSLALQLPVHLPGEMARGKVEVAVHNVNQILGV